MESLELELQVAVNHLIEKVLDFLEIRAGNHLMWGLGIDPGSSQRAVNPLTAENGDQHGQVQPSRHTEEKKAAGSTAFLWKE